MAKQHGPLFITGTVSGICFYQMDGKYYARRKSSLSRKRVKRDPAFARTMAYANLMGRASRLAAEVYRELPRAQREHALYRAMTGQALKLLKQGVNEAAVQEQLRAGRAKTAVQVKATLRQAPVLSPGHSGLKAKVKTVWTSSGKGKVVTEFMQGVDRIKEQPAACGRTWTVIRGEKSWRVQVANRQCLSSS